ncbi:MAG: heme-binding beta-barrel domain-containing protein [Acidimicrobiia bacterium]
MPAPDPSLLGPLAALIGTWEGTKGLDVSYHNAEKEVGDTPYRERVVMNPFGPVDNGNQCLYGLDYRMSAWRNDEVDPFHTEVGYWLWDGAAGQVMRCFMVPRGSTLIAGGAAKADSKVFSMQAELGSQTYGILSNLYLDQMAKTTNFQCTITVNDADSWSYEETTWVQLRHMSAPFAHTDANTLRRVAS